jgi:hypothetical protein
MTPSIPHALGTAKKRLVWIGVLILAVGAVGFGTYRYVQLSREVTRLRTSPQGVADAAKADIKKLVTQVSKLISVPSDETPTVATVSDSEKLKANPFFANAQNGDKVLLYTEAKKAILFRPGENKIIEVGPISIGTPSATAAAEPKTFVLYNGTDVTGLTKSYEATLKKLIPQAVVADRDNAKKRDYTATVVVDLSGTKAVQAGEIAKALGATVVPLPDGEVKPANADFLIILGEDKK